MFQNVAEAKKFIGKSLQPARPVHHLSSKQASAIALNVQTELPGSTEVCLQSKVNWSSEMTEVKILTQTVMLCQPKQHESGAKKERIQYSRDFLLKLSSVSLSQKKPEFLPDHPVVLEKPVKNKPFIDICKK
ncbi:uncharacterized protein C8orf88 homolog [Pipra filicauda]|uniref:Uncharacterized protein C8orf88 homolog n=2 Tax=Pipridae TaxID=114313 RepID=A0A6J0IJC4_9PASS|nr:PREDICTED: uncharacterized protein C8orf88 homolog [Lepidothrix coronata]XP_017686064.1 PREDICTED: uncharacterized protein C8orf88 homolog [Lepidothrix coronata]XP_017686065.1 PREDICTED: uncharacterized protein C8orf88 homolog [Lepidothrix coronata]XP_017931615.1 uncharacterized protein C8orf88 homolog [Manacus vitellinus]XP_027593180.1 uncharacterized protein C8orf88 homolog [Pipra filicauda]XP_039236925.1 uncharacterized protein C8orf88 homolog [Pipra filicauda]XP_051641350.1 uncharacter